ncbi:response regulator transcription factor [Psychromonas sp. RZ22]|uniref:response regulator n=1 Tax=Psychromonas algarum TaxID=2555643 RepID=UPI0010672889|nr:response regulator transcription factor [Psychromonas sp. RZ22]TEW54614.1 response regulator transcription factor [Psychromonas sp. RZ22]
MNKIVIIDDHQLFLYGLKLTLENENNRVVTFDSPFKALIEIKNIQPDLILMDLSMPEMDGVAMMDALIEAEVASPVVVLSACENYQNVYYALQKGAMGFIPKSYSPQEMLSALEVISKGDIFVPEHVAIEIDNIANLEVKNKQDYHLSDRQLQILKLIYEGKKNREIADALCISQDTVKFHQKGLYNALQVSGSLSRLKAVEKALELGLLKA